MAASSSGLAVYPQLGQTAYWSGGKSVPQRKRKRQSRHTTSQCGPGSTSAIEPLTTRTGRRRPRMPPAHTASAPATVNKAAMPTRRHIRYKSALP
jgi:hypothetical protein